MAGTAEGIGRTLVIIGVVIAAVGGLMMLSGRVPFIGRLPGDILIEKKNFTFYFPLATGIIISVVLTLVFWAIRR